MDLKLLVLLLSTCTINLGYSMLDDDDDDDDDDDINRNPAMIENHPYQVAIYYNGIFGGSGAIVNSYTIVSAAHCVNGYNPQYFSIRVGSAIKGEGEEYDVSQIFVHVNYNLFTDYNNDIAVVKTVKQLLFSWKVKPITLQPAGVGIPVGTRANVTGWSQFSPSNFIDNLIEDLQLTQVEVIERYDCETSYRGKQEITETMFCARSIGSTSFTGDYGSPLVAHGRLVGIVSIGCFNGTQDLPSVYASVSALNNFITKHMFNFIYRERF